jgi:TrmH family RNA methyltransferase
MFLLEGERLIHEALAEKAKMKIIAVASGLETKYEQEIAVAAKLGAEAIVVAPELMFKVCDSVNPQGIAAAARLPGTQGISGQNVVALDGVADPGNMGTVLRTAQAFGCKSVVIASGCTDPFSPKCVRAAMGAHFKLDIAFTPDLPELLHRLKTEGEYTVVGGHLNGFESLPEMGRKRVAVIGGEARGISKVVAGQCTALWRIPMAPNAESLNAGVAAGIMMYRLFRF